MDGTIRQTTSPAMFHPTDPKVVYVFTMEGMEFEHGWKLSRSDDAGVTWKTLHRSQPPSSSRVV